MNYDEVLSTANASWLAEARSLMEKAKNFVVVDWEYSFDEKNSAALAQEFDYSLRLDHTKNRAFFAPRKVVRGSSGQ